MTSITASRGRVAARSRRENTDWLAPQVPLIGGLIVLIALAAASVWLFVGSRQSADAVNHTLQMRSKGYRLLSIIQDVETGQRGFLISGDRWYLQPYEAAVAAAPNAIAELQKLAAGNEVQTRTLAEVKTLMEGKLAELAATVALIEKGDTAGATAIVKGNKGNHFMASIREAITRFEDEEERALEVQRAAAGRLNLLLAIASLAGLATILMLALYSIAMTRRSTRQLLTVQDDLRHTNENLEGLVAERVSELQMANEEIQRFAYIVSHDLRAPLVNVMGFTSELDAVGTDVAGFLREVAAKAPELATADRRMAIETDLPEALGFIRTSTEKMDRLINAILKLSREGRRVLTPEKIELAELVRSQSGSLAQQLEARDARIDVQADLPDIVSDRLAIEQIFGNLIENAVKYLQPGRAGHISVSGKAQGAFLRYEIADNGRGIEAKDFERVFELFRRSGEQNTTGEGIGLAYVRNLARRLGGNVTVQSEFGTGSTFVLTLPAVLTPKRRSR